MGKKDTVVLIADIKDTVSLHKILLNVRNDGVYPYCNLFMFIHTIFPDGRKIKDTVEYFLAKPTGEWKGNGFGSIWDHQELFKKNFIFPFKGKYTFKIVQGMRYDNEEKLPGILDVGIRIENQSKSEKKK